MLKNQYPLSGQKFSSYIVYVWYFRRAWIKFKHLQKNTNSLLNIKVRIINTLFRYSEKNNHGQDNKNNKWSGCGRVDNGFARHMNIITNALIMFASCVEGQGKISQAGQTLVIRIWSCAFQCEVPYQWIAWQQVGPVSVSVDLDQWTVVAAVKKAKMCFKKIARLSSVNPPNQIITISSQWLQIWLYL